MKVEIPFVCDQRADCCKEPPYIVVSDQELDLLKDARRDIWFYTIAHDERGFRRIVARPCPFLNADNSCSVYDIRPYNCRRFICGRPHNSPEPFEMTASGECKNFTKRLANVQFYKHARDVQANAQVWATEHGWKP